MDGAAVKIARAAANVSESIESITDVSEQNSVTSEAVRAATAQMSAQAQEVVAPAESLARTAPLSGELVGSLRLDGDVVGAGEACDPTAELPPPSSRRHVKAA